MNYGLGWGRSKLILTQRCLITFSVEIRNLLFSSQSIIVFKEANDGEEETALSCFDVDKDLCIEIKLGKDHDKQKTLVGSSAVQAVAAGSATGTRTPGTGLPGNNNCPRNPTNYYYQ